MPTGMSRKKRSRLKKRFQEGASRQQAESIEKNCIKKGGELDARKKRIAAHRANRAKRKSGQVIVSDECGEDNSERCAERCIGAYFIGSFVVILLGFAVISKNVKYSNFMPTANRRVKFSRCCQDRVEQCFNVSAADECSQA